MSRDDYSPVTSGEKNQKCCLLRNKLVCCLVSVMGVIATLACIFGIFVGAMGYPLHASCKINWEFSGSCKNVSMALVSQIKAWKGAEGCNGTQRCLYSLTSYDAKQVKAIHETPVKRYKDDLTFDLDQQQKCLVKGFSTSQTWYAYLDYGTNYCNLHNLITGAGLDKTPGYIESTSDSVCTQYSKRNCDKY